MFGIGMTEMLVIAVIALVVLGPKRLPELARTLGRTLAEFRRSAADLRREFSDVTGESRIDPPIRLPAKSEPQRPSDAPVPPASEARSEAQPSEGHRAGEARSEAQPSEGRSPSASDQRVRGPAKASEAPGDPDPDAPRPGGASGG